LMMRPFFILNSLAIRFTFHFPGYYVIYFSGGQ